MANMFFMGERIGGEDNLPVTIIFSSLVTGSPNANYPKLIKSNLKINTTISENDIGECLIILQEQGTELNAPVENIWIGYGTYAVNRENQYVSLSDINWTASHADIEPLKTDIRSMNVKLMSLENAKAEKNSPVIFTATPVMAEQYPNYSIGNMIPSVSLSECNTALSSGNTGECLVIQKMVYLNGDAMDTFWLAYAHFSVSGETVTLTDVKWIPPVEYVDYSKDPVVFYSTYNMTNDSYSLPSTLTGPKESFSIPLSDDMVGNCLVILQTITPSSASSGFYDTHIGYGRFEVDNLGKNVTVSNIFWTASQKQLKGKVDQLSVRINNIEGNSGEINKPVVVTGTISGTTMPSYYDFEPSNFNTALVNINALTTHIYGIVANNGNIYFTMGVAQSGASSGKQRVSFGAVFNLTQIGENKTNITGVERSVEMLESKVVPSIGDTVPVSKISRANYDALSSENKNNGTMYIVTDAIEMLQ